MELEYPDRDAALFAYAEALEISFESAVDALLNESQLESALARPRNAAAYESDERTMRERAIRDNEQWGEWSDGLGPLLRSLQADGSDLGLLGLGDDHVERLLAAVLRAESGEPADLDLTPPELATTQRSSRGDRQSRH